MDGVPDTPDTTHTIFWPDVRNYIECKGSLKPGQSIPIGICGLCQDTELDILGLPLSDEAMSGTKPARITVCGHMACHTCLEAWYRTCYREGRRITCPFCRHVLHFTCGHKILGFLIPTMNDIPGEFPNFTSYLSDVPLTLPEGGNQPDTCEGCLRLRLTNSTLKAAGVVRTGLADTFVESPAEILSTDFGFRFISGIQKGLLEIILAKEHDEHPSWATQWDHKERVNLPGNVS
jgi:hypothetical protein